MDKTELNTLLNDLHEALRATPRVDPQLQTALQTLEHDIQRVLNAQAHASGLGEQLQDAETRFAVEHPNLAAVLRDALEKLGKMGV